jgi:pimeloyl-ACP methyl ester carboxylesterase
VIYLINWNLSKKNFFNGKYIKYDITGQGKPLIIVHGTPWSSFNMRHLIKALSKKYTVYFFDLMGYGQSDKSSNKVSLDIQNKILSELINHWNLDNPFIIGHDFGGTTVLRSHLINKCSFSKIILIDPVAISPWGSPFFKHVKKHESVFSEVPDYIHKAIVKAYIETASYRPLDEKILNQTVSPWINEGKKAFYRQIAQADSKFTDEIQSKYKTIDSPTLILWGKYDTWIPLEKGKKLASLIPNSRLKIIPDSGHLVIEEKPELLLKSINEFLQL